MNRKLLSMALTLTMILTVSSLVSAQAKAKKGAAKPAAKTAPAPAARSAAPPANAANLLDINSAPAEKLMTLPGIDIGLAKKIIEHRPYKLKTELTSKKVIPQDAYDHIANSITATQDTGKAAAPAKGKKP
jgi:DNA uptake protein ComE-like DNA-binding protein